MADNEKKPVITHLPAILTGSAALLAAMTTVYVNVRNDLKGEPATPPAIIAPVTPLPTKPELPAAPQELQLRLQRIAVQHDGAVGTADWRFAIEADGQPLFAFEQDSMTSEGGRNILVVAEDRDASALLELPAGKRIAITIKGWRGGWLKKSDAPLVSGEGWLSDAGALAPIPVQAEDGKKGVFTFYFSAIPRKD